MSKISETQLAAPFREIIDEAEKRFHKKRNIKKELSIPDTSDIPIENPLAWLRVKNVICVYVDMVNSTKLSATEYPSETAKAYSFFTESVVRLFHEYDAPYIDVCGDGAFALFDRDQVNRALVAAVTVKTFAEKVFEPIVKKKHDAGLGCHLGIDRGTVLVRKVGLKRSSSRTDRQNEVWAGSTVNMAAKLAAMSSHGELLASARYWNELSEEAALRSCGCGKEAKEKVDLWKEVDVSEIEHFDFDSAYRLESYWCSTHGGEYAQELLDADGSE